jgi:hypothetical protein
MSQDSRRIHRHLRTEMRPPKSPLSLLDRRRFIALSGASAACAFAGASSGFPSTASNRDLRYVVTDRRYEGSVQARGSKRLEVTEGLTRLWYESLLPMWTSGESGVVGLTEAGVWNCLAEQARSHMRKTRILQWQAPPRNFSLRHDAHLVSWMIR